MKKCCCVFLTTVLMLAFITTTLASDLELEFYLQAGSSPIVPIKNLHCVLIDSNKNRILDDHFEDEVVCKVAVSLEEGNYSVVVEEPVSHYFGNANIRVASQSSGSMIFLLDNLGLNLLEGVHTCDERLACLYGDECSCDDACICKRIHNKPSLKLVGQTKEDVVLHSARTTSIEKMGKPRVAGQPTCSTSCVYSNLCEGIGNAYGSCEACYGYAGSGGNWKLLGLLGLLALIDCPGPITSEPVYK